MGAGHGGAVPAEERLRQTGLRRTRGRRAVLAALLGAGRALSHGQIMARMRSGRFDRVSVYRALDAFVAAGLVHAVAAGGASRLFELADRCTGAQCHPHFTCRVCRRTSCLPGVRLPLARPRGWRIERQKVYLEGVCPRCAGS
jgi:Fur family ferric uptake transcriptional regulator